MSEKILLLKDIDLDKIKGVSEKGILIELPIYKSDIINPYNKSIANQNTLKNVDKLVNKLVENIGDDSILFIYGSPVQLIEFNESVSKRLKFHYWISLETGNRIEEYSSRGLRHNHLGLLMYTKNGNLSILDTKNTRFPYLSCLACGYNVKDWGGKKHLMNKNGGGISDVWRDLYNLTEKSIDQKIKDITLNKIESNKSDFNPNLECPDSVIKRLNNLVGKSDLLHIKVSPNYFKKISINRKVCTVVTKKNVEHEINRIILGDCIEEMQNLSYKYPEGIFDITFADPPYNLSKKYKEYDDTLKDEEYENWCNKWLELMVKLTKPTGSIFILNIPKWGLSHASTLNKYAYFENWIVWDALSTPKGKIMPAHYSLLHYTKSPGILTFNNQQKIDPIGYCIRNSCINQRIKQEKLIDERIDVGEIWSDLHRIKHKKDRDDHPCQLPYKLMDRIIQTFSNEGDIMFDPFGGAGTTGICALKNKRNFILMELDPYYKDISERRIFEVENTGNTIRKSVPKKKRSKYTKKFLETKAQELSVALKRKPTMEEYIDYYHLELEEIKKIYSEPLNVLKAGRIGIINNL